MRLSLRFVLLSLLLTVIATGVSVRTAVAATDGSCPAHPAGTTDHSATLAGVDMEAATVSASAATSPDGPAVVGAAEFGTDVPCGHTGCEGSGAGCGTAVCGAGAAGLAAFPLTAGAATLRLRPSRRGNHPPSSLFLGLLTRPPRA